LSGEKISWNPDLKKSTSDESVILSEAKNPENIRFILAAGILWILHCVRSHGDRTQ